ncbi:hypothetical protein AMECASPLE_038789 [Ameca splendens]|uniref:Uncharacterized protein n=1 Tax=Ameca splendens TaxID=208324 RepID=A0ABV0XLH1_9TELE
MTHGERLAYPKFIIRELVKRYKEKNINLHFIYDIASVLFTHMHKTGKGTPQGKGMKTKAEERMKTDKIVKTQQHCAIKQL